MKDEVISPTDVTCAGREISVSHRTMSGRNIEMTGQVSLLSDIMSGRILLSYRTPVPPNSHGIFLFPWLISWKYLQSTYNFSDIEKHLKYT